MMRTILVMLTFLGVVRFCPAQEAPILSHYAEISLLTCSPGEELYSLFGHSAMRVTDPAHGLDVVFNYGTFTFDEDFYFNFSMGKLNYKLSISPFEHFLEEYQYYNRGVVQQTLNLDSAQKQAVFNYLHWNYQPDNRYYLYDFFYDNCSSRLRDVLEKTVGPSLRWTDLQLENKPSFRDLIDPYLIYHPWGDFGIDLGLGLPCDIVPRSREYMFLPYGLFEAYDHASLNGQPLVKKEVQILPAVGLRYRWSLLDPIPLFWLLFGLVALLSAIGWRMGRRFIAVDVLLFSIIGALGCLIFFLWFITDHTATANNLNMLWAWPVHIIAIPLLFSQAFSRIYFLVYGIVLTLSLLGFAFLPQALHPATVPIMLMMLVRCVLNLGLLYSPILSYNNSDKISPGK